MQRIEELDLSQLAWETPEFAIFELQAIRELLIQDDTLRTAFDGIVGIMQAHGTPWGRFAAE
jgi:hypothetical protein